MDGEGKRDGEEYSSEEGSGTESDSSGQDAVNDLRATVEQLRREVQARLEAKRR